MLHTKFEQLFIPKDPGGVYKILFQSAQWFQSFQKKVDWNVGGWLVVLGLTALWDSVSVYIGPSPKEREKEEGKDRWE